MAPRKTKEIQVTMSKQAIVDEVAGEIWNRFYGGPDETDPEKTAANYKNATDMTQKLFEALRKRRDDSKPVIRERRETAEVLADSVGKSMTELQAAYVQLPIGKGKNDAVLYDRVSLPKLRSYAEMEGHPYHQAALDFMNEAKVRFVEREGKGRGKNVAILEKITAGQARKGAST